MRNGTKGVGGNKKVYKYDFNCCLGKFHGASDTLTRHGVLLILSGYYQSALLWEAIRDVIY